MTRQQRKKEIARLAKQFRVLADWTITYEDKSDHHAQCTIHPEEPLAVIYSWGKLSPEADDFLLHEILHVAFRAAQRLGHEGEELFVQDLCMLLSKAHE